MKNPLHLASALSVAVTGLLGLAACDPTPQAPPVAPPVTAPPTTAPATTLPSGPVAPSGWRYYGGDEFNGSALDTTKWRAYYNTYGDGNKELACLTPNNVAVGGGNLTIRSKREDLTCPYSKPRNYTSGFIGSRDSGTYYPAFARFEMRAKLPHSQGLWPAFWLRHRNGASTAEVDIMEYFHSVRPGQTFTTLHLDGKVNASQRQTNFEAPNATPGFHVWAVEISQVADGVKFDFFLDSNLVHSFVDTQHRWLASADLQGTWDIAVNQAVGGNWTGDPDGALGVLPQVSRCAQSGTFPNACKTTGINRVNWASPTSTDYVVDYVRVYTR